jgi:outer membrane immunogenic protein
VARVGFGATASAADVAVAPPAPPPMWAGCHFGTNVGGAGVHNSMFDPIGVADLGSDGNIGLIGGGQAGCDYQTGSWVFGLQGQIDGGATKSTHAFPEPFGSADTISTKNGWLGTVTGRIGYAPEPSILFYVDGGGAWTHSNLSTSIALADVTVDTASDNRIGWVGGVGVAHMFAPNWSVFAEYNYAGFGSQTVNFPISGPVNLTQTIQTVVVGVNWNIRPW